ncbi:transposon Ty3-G Gag-Pol polyprotein [Trichonephila clavipes]|nr:transposon Ty3-G Gag-Pol polyprotein [Trichonephila clavipes]
MIVTITLDQGTQMRSSMYAEFTRMLGTEKIKTTTYPKSNGIVERFHRHLKSAIKAHENDTWYEIVPIILLGLRTTVKICNLLVLKLFTVQTYVCLVT